jgi:protein gp37
MGKSSAYKFMNVAKAFEGKFPQNGNLSISISALCHLASASTPPEAREEALEQAEAGETISFNKAKKLVEKHTSVAQETNALGESLGLPSRGSFILPESDYIDELTHSSPADVDDRFCVAPGANAVDAETSKLQNYQVIEEQEHDYSESEQASASIEEIHLEDGRKLFISRSPGGKKFNRTNLMVDWAWWTWNPVTGCWHGCDYCYARDMANRFYETKFEPTFHPERLSAPANTRVPDEAATDIRAKNVFVSSMGDLFGKWVPDEWILQVFQQVIDNPQWNFLFLTKFPQRLQEICDKLGGFPDNAWVGTTVDTQARVKIAEKAFKNITAGVKWLSCEPLLERLSFGSLEMFDWLVIGGQSKSTRTPEFQPRIEWVSDLFLQARASGCKVYRKENLTVGFPKELPW